MWSPGSRAKKLGSQSKEKGQCNWKLTAFYLLNRLPVGLESSLSQMVTWATIGPSHLRHSFGEWNVSEVSCLTARTAEAPGLHSWGTDVGEVRAHFVPGTVTKQQGWGELQGLVHFSGLGVESEKPSLSRSCCWRSVYTRCGSVCTSIYGVWVCSLLLMRLALPDPQWYLWGHREPVLLPLCTYTHT